MRWLLLAVVALALMPVAARASTPSSGVRGKVVTSGGGACLEGSDCGKRPVPGLTLVFTRNGRATVRVITQADGSFRARLAAGLYAVKVGGERPATTILPSHTSVVRGRFKAVDFVVTTAGRVP